jgi:putative spermidine/putrescine transport system permease protein
MPMRAALSKRALFTSLAVFGVLFLLVPTAIVIPTSLTAGDILAFPPQGLSLRWYASLAQAESLQRAMLRSLYVGVVCTAFAVPTGLMAALAMHRYRLRFGTVLRLYLLLPFTVPLVVSGICLLILYGELGLLGRVWPIGMALCIINLPFMIWAVSASVNALDLDLESAAANLGAPPVQTFLFVTVPAVMPGIITGALLMFVLAINEFVVSLFLVSKRTMTLPVEIFLSIRSVVTPDLAAVAVVYVVIALAAILLLDRIVGLDRFLRSRVNV